MPRQHDVHWLIVRSSKVYAEDIFRTFFKADPMNTEQGIRYRREVLEKGGSQDELKTLTDYLGRGVQMDGFYESLGVSPSAL